MEEVEKAPRAVHKVGDLGRYRLIAELARGGMGVVYVALVRGPGGFNKLFVVKELKAHLVEDPDLVEMFLEEARLSAKLNHPNVVQTIEVGSDGDRHFIAMEFLDGQPLHRILSRTQRPGGPHLPLEYQLHILSHMLEGLQYAHELADFDGTPLGIVHRDVSPHNLIVGYDGHVKLLDFGIAKALDSAHETSTGVLKGKIRYMSPEHAAGQRADRRCDVFAAGVMLWESVVGERMWDPSWIDLQILRALTLGELPRARDRKPDLDPELGRIIDRATAWDADERYATAAELQAELDDYQRSLPVPRFGPREIGKLVGDLFSSERRKMQAVIDEQLRTLRGVASGEYGAIDLPRLSGISGASGTPATGSQSLALAMSASAVTSGADGTGVSAPQAPWWKKVAMPLAITVVGAMTATVAVVALRRDAAPVPSASRGQEAASAQPATSAPASQQPPASVAVSAPASATSPAAAGGPEAATAKRADESAGDPRRTSSPGSQHPGRRPSPAPSAATPPPPAAPTATPGAPPKNRQQIDTNDPYAH